MNNNRLTCRNFVDKQLYVGNDNKGWCDGNNEVPIKRLEGDFTGLNKLDLVDQNPQPNSAINSDDSDYPFELNMVRVNSINLDNKKNE